MDAVIDSAVNDDFVDWCWCAKNPNIYPSKGVYSFCNSPSPERKQWDVRLQTVLCENAHNIFMQMCA